VSLRIVVATGGIVAVTAYAVVFVVQALVLDPLAAVPDTDLARIYEQLSAKRMDVTGDIVTAIVPALLGVVLAVTVGVLGLQRSMSPFVVALFMLGLLVFAVFPLFFAGFGLGGDVADAYGTSGGPHTPWPSVLYGVSGAALLAIIALIPVGIVRARRRRVVDP
jgi:hypothetical protein